jgi:hypothetical protein
MSIKKRENIFLRVQFLKKELCLYSNEPVDLLCPVANEKILTYLHSILKDIQPGLQPVEQLLEIILHPADANQVLAGNDGSITENQANNPITSSAISNIHQPEYRKMHLKLNQLPKIPKALIQEEESKGPVLGAFKIFHKTVSPVMFF